MERTALAKVENGQRRVTAIELAVLARASDVRMDWFVKAPADAVVVGLSTSLAANALDRYPTRSPTVLG